MRATTLIATLAASGGLLFLAGCVSTGGSSNISEYTTSCMFEVDPPGAYVWSDGDTEVKPGGGGTAEGAAAMNACIKAKAAAAGDPLTAGMATESSEIQRSGGQLVETYTYGQPPASAPVSPAQSTAPEKRCRSRNVLSGGVGYNGCS